MQLAVINSLSGIPPVNWNHLTGGKNPFVTHEFLAALERTGCVSPDTGWHTQHVVLYTGNGPQSELISAVPMYLKYYSYGEYVFGWTWANAYTRAGFEYYPKLVAAIPFTPVSGPRLLIAPFKKGA